MHNKMESHSAPKYYICPDGLKVADSGYRSQIGNHMIAYGEDGSVKIYMRSRLRAAKPAAIKVSEQMILQARALEIGIGKSVLQEKGVFVGGKFYPICSSETESIIWRPCFQKRDGRIVLVVNGEFSISAQYADHVSIAVRNFHPHSRRKVFEIYESRKSWEKEDSDYQIYLDEVLSEMAKE